MKPTEGRRRVIIEVLQPSIDAGRYPAKRVLGDKVTVTAAIFSDGHDHVAARLLYRHASTKKWQSVPFTALTNDLWSASFPVDQIGPWRFTVEAWVDHFDTWKDDLAKRLAAQTTSAQDIPLALRIGANLLDAVTSRAKAPDAKKLKAAADTLRALAAQNLSVYEDPIAPELIALVAKYPDLSLSTKYPTELPLWVDRERAAFSAWYELFPRSASPIAGQHGTFKDVEAQLPDIAAMGFDILYMPPIHPIGRAYRKGKNNAVSAADGDVGSPWAIGAAEGGHTAVLPELGTPPRQRTSWNWRSTSPPNARPITPGSPPIQTGSSSGRTGRSSTPRTRRRSIRTSTRSTSSRPTGAASGMRSMASSNSGATAACASSAWITRTPRRYRSGSGASARC
jgi:starch synthase (maltosyl-transferring)